MNRFLLATGLVATLIAPVGRVTAQSLAKPQKSVSFQPARVLTYADIADFAMAAQIVAHVRVRAAKKISGKSSLNLMLGRKRHLVTADVMTLIRGDGGIAPRITYLVDVPADSRGKFPKLPKSEALVLAYRVTGQPAEVQLVAPDAHLFMTPQEGHLARAIVNEAASPAAPPAITGVTDAFHTPGPLEGEGVTQIFLSTRDERPVSLSVTRMPNHAPQWAVHLSEAVGDGVAPPARNTLLWYRLACFLPALPPSDADQKAAEDYRFIKQQLGACPRTAKMNSAR